MFPHLLISNQQRYKVQTGSSVSSQPNGPKPSNKLTCQNADITYGTWITSPSHCLKRVDAPPLLQASNLLQVHTSSPSSMRIITVCRLHCTEYVSTPVLYTAYVLVPPNRTASLVVYHVATVVFRAQKMDVSIVPCHRRN
jgi:hypothetical protein